jgi:uncharacterized protein YukE
METLTFNNAQLIEINTKIKTEIENLNSIFSKIKEDINQIETEWEGNAATEVSSKAKELASFLDILASNGEAYTSFLDTAIQRYQEVDTN